MKIMSTRYSVEKGELTILSLCESAIAMSISLGLAVYFDTLQHLAIGTCLAPLILLRSGDSAHLGKRWFEKGLPRKPKRDNLFLVPFVYLRVLLWSNIVRILATLRHPIKGIRSLPDNWTRVVLCTDVVSPVELVPGSGAVEKTLRQVSYDEEFQSWRALLFGVVFAGLVTLFGHWMKSWFSGELWFFVTQIFFGGGIFAGFVWALGLFCYVVVYLYRISLKSTALIWLPLIYIVRTTFDESLSLPARLDEIRLSALWKIIRLVSWITLLLLTAKVVILPNCIHWWNSQPWTSVLNVYVMPNQIHTWHIAAGLNALIALVGYYAFLERAPRFLSEGAWHPRGVAVALQVFSFVRGIVSLYTITVGIYLTVTAALGMAWPRWSGEVFPW